MSCLKIRGTQDNKNKLPDFMTADTQTRTSKKSQAASPTGNMRKDYRLPK